MKPQNEIPWPLIEDGQVWQMADDVTYRIGQLGKKLVHYILFKGQPTHNAPIVTNAAISSCVGRFSFFGGISPELTCSITSAQ